MRFRLSSLLIVVAIAPVIIWAATLWLATWLEAAGRYKYKTSGRGTAITESAKNAKAAERAVR